MPRECRKHSVSWRVKGFSESRQVCWLNSPPFSENVLSSQAAAELQIIKNQVMPCRSPVIPESLESRTKVGSAGIQPGHLIKEDNLLFKRIKLFQVSPQMVECLRPVFWRLPFLPGFTDQFCCTVKTHAKPNGGMRSEKYVGYYADTASVLETEQRQHRSRFKKLHEVFGRKAKKLRELLRNAGHGRKTCEA